SDIVIRFACLSVWSQRRALRLPRGLLHPGELPLVRQFPEADTAHTEAAHIAARPAARPTPPDDGTAVLLSRGELGLPGCLRDLTLFGHRLNSSSESAGSRLRLATRGRHPEELE